MRGTKRRRRLSFGRGKRKPRQRSPYISLPPLYRNFRIDEDFKNKVKEELLDPAYHESGKPEEICGTFRIEWDESKDEYVLVHNNVKQGMSTKTLGDLIVERGGLENGVQFCHPKLYVHNVLWHTHPRGVPAYPSGSDVFITIINDCTRGLTHQESTAQTFVEFLFTEHGFWVIHRNVYENGGIASALDFTETRGRPIRMKNKKMTQVVNIREKVDELIDKLEQRLIQHYYRSRVPDQEAVRDIQELMDTDEDFKLIHNKLKIHFFPWEREQITLPEILFTTKVGGVCIAQ
jgi:hypothetical protein